MSANLFETSDSKQTINEIWESILDTVKSNRYFDGLQIKGI